MQQSHGQDETPYPTDELSDLFQQALASHLFGQEEFFSPLRSLLDPVRGVLRSHPSLNNALGLALGNDDFQIDILNHGTRVSLSDLAVGLQARRQTRSDECFGGAVAELNQLLRLACGQLAHPLPSDLDLGYDVALFHGPAVRSSFDLGEGYLLKPFEELTTFIDIAWMRDLAPEQYQYRRWGRVFAIGLPFRWKPQVLQANDLSYQRVRIAPPLFRRWAHEFAHLFSVVLGQPVSWIVTFEGCVSRNTCDLLGMAHQPSHTERGPAIGHRFNPFDKLRYADDPDIATVQRLFAKRRATQYPELAPVVQRLAEALSREGRYANEDRVLDLAVVLERMFKPRRKQISRELSSACSDFLGKSDDQRNKIEQNIRHFYKVRSAIIHGKDTSQDNKLRSQSGEAFRRGFDVARAALIEMLE